MTQEKAYYEYNREVEITAKKTGMCGPHCDNLVLHCLGECEHCDRPEFASLHGARLRLAINYTGQYNLICWPCPAETRRKLNQIEKWPGNRISAEPDDEVEEPIESIWPIRDEIFEEIELERRRQNKKFTGKEEGEQHHNIYKWLAIIGEELGEANQAVLDHDFKRDPFTTDSTDAIETELIQTAACCVALLERIKLKDEALWL